MEINLDSKLCYKYWFLMINYNYSQIPTQLLFYISHLAVADFWLPSGETQDPPAFFSKPQCFVDHVQPRNRPLSVHP